VNEVGDHVGRVAGAPAVEGADDAAGAYGETVTLATEQLRRIMAIEPPLADRELIERNVIDRLRERLALRRRLQRDLATVLDIIPVAEIGLNDDVDDLLGLTGRWTPSRRILTKSTTPPSLPRRRRISAAPSPST
jgi:hypothetical protein